MLMIDLSCCFYQNPLGRLVKLAIYGIFQNHVAVISARRSVHVITQDL